MRTYLRFLLLGSSILLSNCNDHEEVTFAKADFIFINSTSFEVECNCFQYFELEPEESFLISKENIPFEGEISPDRFLPPISDEVIILNYDLCDTLSILQEGVGKGEGPSGIQNYESEKISETYYRFTYRFTDADFDDAVLCEP